MNDVCWGELMPGDVIKWNVSTSQGPRLTLLVINRYQGELLFSENTDIVEFFDMESGVLRQHECRSAVFIRDLNAFLVERGHAKDA